MVSAYGAVVILAGIFTDIGDVAEVVLYVAIVALWGLLGVIVPVYCYGLWKAFNPDGCETIGAGCSCVVFVWENFV